MASARKKARKPIKVTDEMAAIRCAVGDGIIREEVWEDVGGAVVATTWPSSILNCLLGIMDGFSATTMRTGARIGISQEQSNRSSPLHTRRFLNALSQRSTR